MLLPEPRKYQPPGARRGIKIVSPPILAGIFASSRAADRGGGGATTGVCHRWAAVWISSDVQSPRSSRPYGQMRLPDGPLLRITIAVESVRAIPKKITARRILTFIWIGR